VKLSTQAQASFNCDQPFHHGKIILSQILMPQSTLPLRFSCIMPMCSQSVMEDDMFDARQILNALTGAGQAGQGGASSGLGGLIGSVLSQATQGLGSAARQADAATGASGMARDATQKMTGSAPEDLLSKARDMLSQNQMAGGAVLGGLGGLLLGTSTGRSLATDAAKLGGIALIGGLAYKALQNYQAGRPLLDQEAMASLAQGAEQPAKAAEAATDTAANDTAILLLRTMIAAAASDGVIDDDERGAILSEARRGGLDPEAASWIEAEFENPASVADLAAAAPTPAVAVQAYVAARLAINPDLADEAAFLADLKQALNLDDGLAATIDATVQQARA
jgi:uncharacterized membrane protein YebE (DUF533 family)